MSAASSAAGRPHSDDVSDPAVRPTVGKIDRQSTGPEHCLAYLAIGDIAEFISSSFTNAVVGAKSCHLGSKVSVDRFESAELGLETGDLVTLGDVVLKWQNDD